MVNARCVVLRILALSAVDARAGHRQAADRFGASAAGVSRRRKLARERGGPRPGAPGGDRRSGRVEAQAGLIRALLEETRDCTVEGLRAAPAARGHAFGCGTLQRFFHRHGITRKVRWVSI